MAAWMTVPVLLSLLLFHIFTVAVSAASTSGIQVEALMAFKTSISDDPLGVLVDWTSASHHCNWTGITCDASSNVVNISLIETELKGTISPFLANISTLQVIDFSVKNFSRQVPPELGYLLELGELMLYANLLSDPIPLELGSLKSLRILDLSNTYLSGSIPESICNCTQLFALGMEVNNLTEFAYMRTVTTKADVFCFGILMMELFAKKRPTGAIEENGVPISLQQLVENALACGLESVLMVADPDMGLPTETEEDKVVNALQLTLSCTCFSAEERPDMNEVLSLLLKLSEVYGD